MSYSLKRRLTAGVGALVISLGIFFSVRDTHPPNPDLAVLSRRLDSFVIQALIIESEDKKMGQEVFTQLLPILEAVPKTLVSRIQYDVSEERAFFRKHIPLYFNLEQLHKLKKYLEQAIQFEKDLFNPFSLFQGKTLKEPELDFDSFADSLTAIRPFASFPNGQYVTKDGRKRAVLILAGAEFSQNVGNVQQRLKSIINTFGSESLELKLRLASSDDSVLEEIFNGSPAPFVFYAHTGAEAKKIANSLTVIPNISVKTLDGYIPTEQEEKIKLLRSMKNLLSPTIVKVFSSDEKKWAQRFLETEVSEPLEERDLPLSIRSRFTVKDTGAIGHIVYVYPRIQQREEIKKKLEVLNTEKGIFFDARFP